MMAMANAHAKIYITIHKMVQLIALDVDTIAKHAQIINHVLNVLDLIEIQLLLVVLVFPVIIMT
jgi:hypothetical protein